MLGGPEYDLELNLKENDRSIINLGFRFDSEEMAAILLNLKLNYRPLKGFRSGFTARLSKNPFVRLDYSLEKDVYKRQGISGSV